MLDEVNCKILLYTSACDVIIENNTVKGVITDCTAAVSVVQLSCNDGKQFQVVSSFDGEQGKMIHGISLLENRVFIGSLSNTISIADGKTNGGKWT